MNAISHLILVMLAGASSMALADETRTLPVKPSQEWKQECGSCHLAFPPGLLPADSWRKLMGDLDKHFGSDASLNPRDTKEITDFLVKNAARRWHGATAPERITETPFFRHEHREIAARVWKREAIKSPANCVACHPGAEKGNFDEHRVRIPN